MEEWKWCRDGPHGLEADEAEGHSSPGFGFDGEDTLWTILHSIALYIVSVAGPDSFCGVYDVDA